MRKTRQRKAPSTSNPGTAHGSSKSVAKKDVIPSESGGSQYERERLLRIQQNRARMEALGLPTMAASLARNTSSEIKDKGEANQSGCEKDDDEDYKPNVDSGDEDADELSSSSEGFEDEDYVNNGRRSKPRRPPAKNTKSVAKKKVSIQKRKLVDNLDFMDEDEALKMAIAFSLKDSGQGCEADNGSQGKGQSPQVTGNKKGRKSITNRAQMNEDDVVIHFCQFDEVGKGSITLRDLERMASSHDFTWTDNELMNMIRCFDGDRDGKLSMEDFRNIVVRCNLLQASKDPELRTYVN